MTKKVVRVEFTVPLVDGAKTEWVLCYDDGSRKPLEEGESWGECEPLREAFAYDLGALLADLYLDGKIKLDDIDAAKPILAQEKASSIPPGRNRRPCIATGCGAPSKGPRFHFLCENHVGATASEIAAWQDAARVTKPRVGRRKKVQVRTEDWNFWD